MVPTMRRYRQAGVIGATALTLFFGIPFTAISDDSRLDDAALFPAEISTIGMDRLTGAPVVLLRAVDSGRIIPIWIGVAEAQAIALAMHGIEPRRPMTHDLMAALVRAGGTEIEEIAVHDLRDDTYFGAVHMKRGEDIMRIDSRPSDALALALRLDVPIRVAGKVINEARDFQFVPPEEADQVVRVFGMTAVYASAQRRAQFDIGDRDGVFISEISEYASRGDLQVGDLITMVNETPVGTPAEFLNAAGRHSPGTEVTMTYIRRGEERTTAIEVPRERTSTSDPI